MKFDVVESFVADYARLTVRERELFRQAVRRLNAAYARRGDRPIPAWPAVLRIKPVLGAPGVFELTWSFSGPDGRATFELVNVAGEPALRWRRIGGHRILREP